MRPTRRSFLVGSALAALAAPRVISARGLLVAPQLDDVVKRALAAATKAGASYADVRLVRRRDERLAAREDKIERVSYSEEYGLGVRVIANGAWGFAASPVVTPDEAEATAKKAVAVAKANAALAKQPVVLAPVPPNVDVWQTALTKDPFQIPLEDKAELLLAINAAAMRVPGVRFSNASFACDGEWKLFASTDGAYIEQDLTRIGTYYTVTAVDDRHGEFATRAHTAPPRQAGWEYIESLPLLTDAPRIAAEAVEKLKAPPVTPGRRDLVLEPSNLWLTIHESIGHPTELDRALGYEANFAGTSYATPDKLGKLQIGSPLLTFYADKTTPGGLATCGYDDDGVATGRWNLVDRGVFVGYQTTREQAGWIHETASRGTSYADSYASCPFQRMPNVSLAPGARPIGIEELVAATDDGILIVGNGSWSIDHQRLNFQFGGQAFWEIRHGRRTRMVKDVAYQANTLDFWRSCDLIGGPQSWWMFGTMSDGKGEPGQVNAVSHGCPPARFRGVNVLSTNRRTA
ncbi:MAG: TldD/PmbA family protein [Acidobacteriota bacterium]